MDAPDGAAVLNAAFAAALSPSSCKVVLTVVGSALQREPVASAGRWWVR
jgi:hypothetical protein